METALEKFVNKLIYQYSIIEYPYVGMYNYL